MEIKDPKKLAFYGLGLAVVVLAIVSVLLLVKNSQQRTEINEIVEQMTFDKEMLEDEYEQLAMQFDGYQAPDIHNDSLVELLTQEKQRVQDLLEELRITKATNARRIAELKKELATVRAVMVSYVQQIDSLDRANKQLVIENKQVKKQYQEVSQQAKQLEKERTQLKEVVTRASMLEISSVHVTWLNSRDKKTTMVSQLRKLQFGFTIARNVTTEPGLKTMYLRLSGPDGEVFQGSPDDVFKYENKKIAYSAAQQFEYAGDEVSGYIYYATPDQLLKGWYNADFFVDGHLLTSYPFELK